MSEGLDLDALNAATVAKMLDVSTRQLSNYINTKGLPSHGQGRERTFVYAEVREWDYEYRLSNDRHAGSVGNDLGSSGAGTSDGPPEDLKTAEARHKSYMADIKKIELEQRRGQLVPMVDVKAVLEDVAKGLQVEIRGLPTRIVGSVLALRDRDALFAYLTDETNLLCTRLSQLDFDPHAKPVPEEDPEDE